MVSPTYSSYSQLCVCRVCSSKLVRQSSVERRALQPTPQHCGSEVRCKVMTDSQTLTRTWAAPSSRRYAPSYAHSPHTPAAPHPSGVHAASCLLQRSTFLSALYLPRHPQTRITHTHSTVKHLRRPPGGSGAHLREGGPARAVSAQWDLGIYQSRDHDSCPRAGAQTEIARGRRQGRTHKMDGRMPREMRPWARTETSARHTKTDTGTETGTSTTVPPPSLSRRPRDRDTRRNTSAHTLGAHPVPREFIFTEGHHGVSTSLNLVHFFFRLRAPLRASTITHPRARTAASTHSLERTPRCLST